MSWFTDLKQAAYNLTPKQRKIVVGVGLISATVATVVILAAGFHVAAQIVPAESPVWEAALQLRLILVRLAVTPAVVTLAVALGLGLEAVFGKTELARRLWTWAPTDTEGVKAEKTRNYGNFVTITLTGLIIGLLFGVLR